MGGITRFSLTSSKLNWFVECLIDFQQVTLVSARSGPIYTSTTYCSTCVWSSIISRSIFFFGTIFSRYVKHLNNIYSSNSQLLQDSLKLEDPNCYLFHAKKPHNDRVWYGWPMQVQWGVFWVFRVNKLGVTSGYNQWLVGFNWPAVPQAYARLSHRSIVREECRTIQRELQGRIVSPSIHRMLNNLRSLDTPENICSRLFCPYSRLPPNINPNIPLLIYW